MPDPTPAIVDLVRALIQMVRGIDPTWTRVFFRFHIRPGQYGCRVSYTNGANTVLVSAVRYGRTFDSLNKEGEAIFKALGKPQGVMLVTSDAGNRYNLHFEYEDLDRWMISKLNGGTGVPVGFDPSNPANPAG